MVREVTDRSTPAPPPTLDAPFPIQVSQVEQFTRNGFLKLTNVLDPETIERYGAAVTRGVVERNTMHLPLEQRSAYDKAFLQVENLWQHSAEVREFVFGRRLAQIAADLLGVDGVRLYHDQALYKEPGGGLTPWHADQFYWPLSSDRACTVWIPLQKTPWTLGPLQFAAGSHRVEIGRDLPISEHSEARMQVELAARNFQVEGEPYEAGDVSYHLGWTFHRAPPNTSTEPRGVMTIIYMDADITIAPPSNRSQKADLDRWLGGALPGSTPDGSLNPLLYRRSAN
jgi:ectoine hydroxylase-related dioxygenase (phytanoyl-CoA dioxygenase family)